MKAKIPPAKPQTFAERVADPTKAALSCAFMESIVDTARNNDRHEDDVLALWNEYCERCLSADQSPVFREFVTWYKLAGAGPLA